MKIQADKHMHFAGTSSTEAFQFYIYIARKPENLII